MNNEHIENPSEAKARFPCEICEKTYKNNSDLTKHINSVHVKCKWCNYRSQNRNEDISKHYWNAHQKEYIQDEIDQLNEKNGFDKENDSGGSGAWVKAFQEKLSCKHPFYICVS